MRLRAIASGLAVACSLGLATSLGAAETAPLPAATGPMPGVGFSLLRLFGALVLVLALFLAGVWLFKHWQRLTVARGRSPKLNLLEIKPLGNRHALYVVAYEHQRLLIASSPTGVTLLTHLPEAEKIEPSAGLPAPGFAQALQQVLAARS